MVEIDFGPKDKDIQFTPRPAGKRELRLWFKYYLVWIEDIQRKEMDHEKKERLLSAIYYHLYRNGLDLRMVERFVAERLGIAGLLFWETTEQKEWSQWRKLMHKDLK
jgi:hypothetical protein